MASSTCGARRSVSDFLFSLTPGLSSRSHDDVQCFKGAAVRRQIKRDPDVCMQDTRRFITTLPI